MIVCPINLCNSNKVEFSYSFKDIKYYKCNTCLVYFQNPFPNNQNYLKKYNEEYFNDYQENPSKTKKLRSKQYRLDLNMLKKFYKDSLKNKVLDYGCGPGNFLSSLKSKVYGYELNEDAKLHKKITRIKFNEIKKHKFDLISLRGSIEHIPDFIIKIKLLSKQLKKNGLLFITATPNSHNLNFRLSKKAYNQNHWGHIYHFDYVNLSYFFLKLGLYNIHTSLDYSDTVYYNFLNDYKKQKQLLDGKGNKKKLCNPGVGNMMTLFFKKMI